MIIPLLIFMKRITNKKFIQTKNTFKNFEDRILKTIQNKRKTKCKKNSGSLIELLPKLASSQSIMIKIGNIFEEVINDYIKDVIKKNSQFSFLRFKCKKQIDLVFKKNKTIYYFEIKSNINLDTEKTIKTKDKLEEIEELLSVKYPKHIINCKILNLRFTQKELEIDAKFKKPLDINDLIGYDSFFKLLEIKVSSSTWKNMFYKIQKIII